MVLKLRFICPVIFLAFLGMSCTTVSLQTMDLVRQTPQICKINPGGSTQNPQGHTLTVNSNSLVYDGQPWVPVMGEFHFARYPENEWRDELLKMKAGGVEIASTYVFWIHHEEVEGQFNWSGRRSLRNFVKLCGEVNLPILVRIGPWCHGEARNGGFPDWLLERGWKLRSNNPEYLDKVRILYAEIAQQLQGLLWKDGGPVIGVQMDNEYRGPAEYLLTLKRMARQAGLDVPLYTRTGWPKPSTPVPFGEILPLFGQYPDGFWDRSTDPMPSDYWKAFNFDVVRMDVMIANEQLDRRRPEDEAGVQRYPYLTCELGGGMMPSYHRRIRIAPMDIAAMVLTKIGSGNNLPGYYMYHGGTNPEGKLTTLQEAQAASKYNHNDLPVKTYDFQTPLGEFGQVRRHYHLLRRLHLFLRDFGRSLTVMPSALPEERPSGKDDADTLRWAVRSDGHSGYLFVNNYQRLLAMPPKPDTQFSLNLNEGSLTIPAEPITVPAGVSFFWPFNLDIYGTRLIYATAQPICRLEDDGTYYMVFAQTAGMDTEFVFDADGITVESTTGKKSEADGRCVIKDVKPGTGAAICLQNKKGEKTNIILLEEEASLGCWKGVFSGRERLFLSRANLIFDGDSLRLRSKDAADFSVDILPAPETVTVNGAAKKAKPEGLFGRFTFDVPSTPPVKVTVEKIQDAGPARDIKKGAANVAEGPSEADWQAAAVWRVSFPDGIDAGGDYLLDISYVGDVARVYCGDTLLTDNFYNGSVFEVGLRRYAPDIYQKGLTLKILPLKKDTPIYLPKEAQPDFGSSESFLELTSVKITEQPEIKVSLPVRSTH